MKALGAMLALSCGSLACSAQSLTLALEEPIRVPSAQFDEGELPGSPPLTADEVNAGVNPKTPVVLSVTFGNPVVPPGEPSRSFSGVASSDAVSVGVRFADLGSGYWILPTGGADATIPGSLSWGFRAAFRRGVTPGKHRLLFTAFDEQGRSGTQTETTLCLLPEVPDNGNVCDPTKPPPALVVSLGWDAPVDLDLRVVTPTGKVVDSKHPSTADADADGNVDPEQPGIGLISQDSFAACSADGRRRESLVFQSTPPAGNYLVYANLYEACGEAGASFDVSLHNSVPGDAPDTLELAETFHQAGQLSAAHANGGSQLGMFITSFNVK
jgi:hypothetical protein